MMGRITLLLQCVSLAATVSLARAEIRRVPYDSTSMQFPVDPGQAIQIARQWVQNPTLEMNLLGVLQDDEIFQSDLYLLESPDGQLFQISPHTGLVDTWSNRSSSAAYQQQLIDNQSNPLPELPPAQIDEIALGFAQAHYPGFVNLNMQRSFSRRGYILVGTAIAGGGFFSGNYCKITVNVFTGEVVGYSAFISGTVTIPLTPTLTDDGAAAIALNSFNGAPGVASAFTYQGSELHAILDSLGQQRLVWVVFVATSTDPNLTFAGWQQQSEIGATRHRVYVDAHNGQIVNQETFLGSGDGKRPAHGWRSRGVRFRSARTARSSARRATSAAPLAEVRVFMDDQWIPSLLYPPLVERGVVYWYAGYLKSRLWRMSVRRDGSQLTIADREGRRFVLRDGARGFLEQGTRRLSTAALRVIRGRTYLPAATWEAITGARFRWDAGGRALRIR